MPDADARLPVDRPAERLEAVYAQAERDLRAMVRAAARRGAGGTAAYFERQRRRVAARLEQLRAASGALVPAAVEGAYVPSAEAAAAVLGDAFDFAGPHERQVDALAQAMRGRLERAHVTVGRSMDDVFRRVALEELVGGTARGETRRAISARVRSRLADEGVTAFVDRRGARWRLETYSRMTVRTGAREAASVGTVDGVVDAGGDLITISDHGTDTPLCQEFEGKTYSVSGRDARHPPLVRLPPFHPNCEHVATPAAATFEDFERELGLRAA